MESIFSQMRDVDHGSAEQFDEYEAKIKALIADAVDYSLSELSPEREENLKYYYGEAPGLAALPQDPLMGDPGTEDDDTGNRATIVSTDVRDVIMAVLPSMMRIFTESEQVANFEPNGPGNEAMAQQATADVLHQFWEDNPGFLILHTILKDTFTEKVGIVRWWTDDLPQMKQEEYRKLSGEQLSALIQEANEKGDQQAELVDLGPQDGDGMYEFAIVNYMESKPLRVIEAVPPEDFRVDRRARNPYKSRLIGSEQLVSGSDVVQMGFDQLLVEQYIGNFDYYSIEKSIRAPGSDTSFIDSDMVIFGEYFIRIDQDGDGIDELHRIRTLGPNHDIIEDVIVNNVQLAVFCGDPRPHTVVGDALADLAKDIQQIKTMLLRGALDSLTGSMFPDLVVNELLVNMNDALADGVGRIIRTKSDPASVIKELRSSFNGGEVFEMMDKMDMIRQSRTGISEASKGVDPKAFQSTNLAGIDTVVNGAQERIELIARILAETGFKDMMKGLLYETVRYPNRKRVLKMNGEWVEYDQSTYNPDLSVKVNPTLGKGSDMSRLATLKEIKDAQLMIMTTLGADNPIVTMEQALNTYKDMLRIVNIRNTTRYFNDITPEIQQQLSGPKEPSPEEKIAMAEIEKVKAGAAQKMADIQQTERKMAMDDDFRRDKLELDSIVKLVAALSKNTAAPGELPTATSVTTSRNQPG